MALVLAALATVAAVVTLPVLLAPSPPRVGESVELPPPEPPPRAPQQLGPVPSVVEASGGLASNPVGRNTVPATVRVLHWRADQDLELLVRDGRSRQPSARIPLGPAPAPGGKPPERGTLAAGGDGQQTWIEVALGPLPLGEHTVLLVRPSDRTGTHHLASARFAVSRGGVGDRIPQLDARTHTVTVEFRPEEAGNPPTSEGTSPNNPGPLSGRAHRLQRVDTPRWTPDILFGQIPTIDRTGRMVLPGLGKGRYQLVLHGVLLAKESMQEVPDSGERLGPNTLLLQVPEQLDYQVEIRD